jgi:hypothetical protein
MLSRRRSIPAPNEILRYAQDDKERGLRMTEKERNIRMKRDGASMNTRRKTHSLLEREIDKIVVAQADDEAAWGKPVRVRRTTTAQSDYKRGVRHECHPERSEESRIVLS